MGQLRWPFIAPCGKAALRSRDPSRAPHFDNALGHLGRGRFRWGQWVHRPRREAGYPEASHFLVDTGGGGDTTGPVRTEGPYWAVIEPLAAKTFFLRPEPIPVRT